MTEDRPKLWAGVTSPKTGEGHAIPINDIVEHDLSTDCVCGPVSKNVSVPGLMQEVVYVHFSLDNREKDEET